MALCINEVFAGKTYQSQIRRNAMVLARRIARNREIAGLHYPSDSEGARALAGALMMPLVALPNGTLFHELVDDARDELEWVLP